MWEKPVETQMLDEMALQEYGVVAIPVGQKGTLIELASY